jgi:hypothetical protein
VTRRSEFRTHELRAFSWLWAHAHAQRLAWASFQTRQPANPRTNVGERAKVVAARDVWVEPPAAHGHLSGRIVAVERVDGAGSEGLRRTLEAGAGRPRRQSGAAQLERCGRARMRFAWVRLGAVARGCVLAPVPGSP